MNQSTFDTVLAALLVALFGAVGFAIKKQIAAGEQNRQAQTRLADQFRQALNDLSATFAGQMRDVSVTLAELNTGASAGARAAIADLREEMRTGLRDATRDLTQLRSEHDNLAERHNSLNGTTVQLIERVNGTREQVHELRRDLYRIQPQPPFPPRSETG